MKIINIGSLNIDRIYGVEHFVQPGETIKVRAYSEACGGKGLNQSIAAARSGAEVHHAGAVGSDGGMLLEILRISGVHTGKTNDSFRSKRSCRDPGGQKRVRTIS